MHELPVTESILEIALRHASTEPTCRITNLYLVIGELASIIDDSVQFYWDIVSKGTIAEGAKLNFRRIPAELLCIDCNQKYKLGDDDLSCPNCGGLKVRVINGEEFYLESIEVETNDADKDI